MFVNDRQLRNRVAAQRLPKRTVLTGVNPMCDPVSSTQIEVAL
jgi:hypothetical protein